MNFLILCTGIFDILSNNFSVIPAPFGQALGRTAPLDRAAVGRLEQRYRTVGSAPRGWRGESGGPVLATRFPLSQE